MANNPYVNKVQLADGTVLMDISGDTVAASNMLSGILAHNKSGAQVTGNIPTITAGNVTISGTSVSIPAGYFAQATSKEITAVTLSKPSSGTKTFSITVPNGNTTATFVFNVDSSGNVTITET